MKFGKTFQALDSIVKCTGLKGKWRRGENLNQYRANSGAVLNWWESTGTLTFQGPEAAAVRLKKAFVKARQQARETRARNCRRPATTGDYRRK
jgi:hypothetical protein